MYWNIFQINYTLKGYKPSKQETSPYFRGCKKYSKHISDKQNEIKKQSYVFFL